MDKALDSLFIAVQLCLVGLLLVGVYVGVIQGAWIPHHVDTFVWIQGLAGRRVSQLSNAWRDAALVLRKLGERWHGGKCVGVYH